MVSCNKLQLHAAAFHLRKFQFEINIITCTNFVTSQICDLHFRTLNVTIFRTSEQTIGRGKPAEQKNRQISMVCF